MQISAVFAALVLAVSARPQSMFRVKATMDYSWEVSEWTGSCPNGSCKYDFKVTGTENLNGNPKKPGFVAHCAGDTEGSPYRLCDIQDESATTRRVAAKLQPWTTKPANSTAARIQVSLQYTDFDTDSMWWNYTGHAETRYTPTPLNFKITPDEIYGVA
ncbi:hypothetical protein PG984_000664 [Apiospora sp. TS-2023a]